VSRARARRRRLGRLRGDDPPPSPAQGRHAALRQARWQLAAGRAAPKGQLCHIFVLPTWVETAFGVAVGEGDPALPVAFGAHLPDKGTKGAPKASTDPGVKNPRQTSVKCTVSCRLVNNKRARAVLEDMSTT